MGQKKALFPLWNIGKREKESWERGKEDSSEIAISNSEMESFVFLEKHFQQTKQEKEKGREREKKKMKEDAFQISGVSKTFLWERISWNQSAKKEKETLKEKKKKKKKKRKKKEKNKNLRREKIEKFSFL